MPAAGVVILYLYRACFYRYPNRTANHILDLEKETARGMSLGGSHFGTRQKVAQGFYLGLV